MPRYGFDSLSDARFIWRQAVGAAGQAPDFWIRYIGGAGAVTAAEVAALHSLGVAVGLLYNATTSTRVQGTAADGAADARQAIAAAQALGAPANVRLGLDLEAGWQPSADYVIGWARAQAAGPFAGSGLVYGAPYDPGFQGAMQGAQEAGGAAAALVLWSAQPEPGPTPVPEWGPATCWNYPVVLWQFAEAAFGGIVDLDLAADGYSGLWEVPVPTFSDVPEDAWYTPDVSAAVAAGLMQGVGGNRFAPEADATRADLAAVGARIAERWGWAATTVPVPPFRDVPADAWYSLSVDEAVAAGLMQGVGDGLFDPEAAATRADLAAVAARIALRAGWVTSNVSASDFRDVPADAWYSLSVDEAVAAGLMQGVGGGRFAPGADAVRADLAAVAARIAERAGWVAAITAAGANAGAAAAGATGSGVAAGGTRSPTSPVPAAPAETPAGTRPARLGPCRLSGLWRWMRALWPHA